MSWRVFLTASLQPDLDRLTEAEQALLADALFEWVEAGPPRTNGRIVGGVELFEDTVSGFVVAYFVDEREPVRGDPPRPEGLRSHSTVASATYPGGLSIEYLSPYSAPKRPCPLSPSAGTAPRAAATSAPARLVPSGWPPSPRAGDSRRRCLELSQVQPPSK